MKIPRDFHIQGDISHEEWRGVIKVFYTRDPDHQVLNILNLLAVLNNRPMLVRGFTSFGQQAFDRANIELEHRRSFFRLVGQPNLPWPEQEIFLARV